MLNIDRVYNVNGFMPFIEAEASIGGLEKYFTMERRFTGDFDLVVFMVGYVFSAECINFQRFPQSIIISLFFTVTNC